MKPGDDRWRGQWDMIDRILGHLNTYDEVMIDKGKLYAEIMTWRPQFTPTSGVLGYPYESEMEISEDLSLGMVQELDERRPPASVNGALHR